MKEAFDLVNSAGLLVPSDHPDGGVGESHFKRDGGDRTLQGLVVRMGPMTLIPLRGGGTGCDPALSQWSMKAFREAPL